MYLSSFELANSEPGAIKAAIRLVTFSPVVFKNLTTSFNL